MTQLKQGWANRVELADIGLQSQLSCWPNFQYNETGAYLVSTGLLNML